MLRFILKKLLYLVPTMIGITLVAFGFIRLLPGDPVLLMAGERGVSPERYARLRRSSAMTSRSGSNTSTISATCCRATWAIRW